jgi:hypothetical protein
MDAPKLWSEDKLKRFNDAADKLGKLKESWDNRLTLRGQSFHEQYIRGRMAVILNVDFSDAVPVNRRFPCTRNESTKYPVASIVFNVNGNHGRQFVDLNQLDVLVRNVQIVQGPEGVIPSRVRLYGVFKESDDLFRGMLYFSLCDAVFKSLLVRVDRKFEVLEPSLSFHKHGIADCEIKSTVQIVEGISQDRVDIGWKGFSNLELQHMLSGFRILADSQAVVVRCEKSMKAVPKLMDVLLGPFNL